MGLVAPTGDVTEVRIRAVNTGAKVLARVQPSGGELTLDGETEIAGLPGSVAPIEPSFMGVVGSSTGALLPTGNLRDQIDVLVEFISAEGVSLTSTGLLRTARKLAEGKIFILERIWKG